MVSADIPAGDQEAPMVWELIGRAHSDQPLPASVPDIPIVKEVLDVARYLHAGGADDNRIPVRGDHGAGGDLKILSPSQP